MGGGVIVPHYIWTWREIEDGDGAGYVTLRTRSVDGLTDRTGIYAPSQVSSVCSRLGLEHQPGS